MKRSRLVRKPPVRKPVDFDKLKRSNPPKRYGRVGSKNPNARGWTQRVFALYGFYCLACPKSALTKAVQAHHVVPRQRIANDARKAQEERDALEYDARNGFPICLRCHEQHETATKRIPRSRIPVLGVEWARDHGYADVLSAPVYP